MLFIDKTKEFISIFGLKFLLFVSIIEHGLKGLVAGGGSSGLIGIPILFILKEYGTLSTSRIQILKTITLLPWSLKPVFAMLSDSIWIFGYNKIYLMMFFSILAAVSSILISVLWIGILSPELLSLLLFLIFCSIAINDLLVEAKYSEKIKSNPEHGPTMVSFVWGGIFIGEIFSVIFTGLLLSFNHKRLLYLVVSIPLIVIIIPIYLNWLGENKKENKNSFIEIDKVKFTREWKLYILSLSICILTILLGLLGLFNIKTKYLFLSSIISGIIMIIAFHYLVNPIFAKIQTFFIIQNMFTISIDSATFFFYTDDNIQFPEGPHFTIFFYITILGITGSFFGFIGIVIYNYFMKDWKYRNVFVITNLLYAIVNLLNVIIFKRWNKIIGIPDTFFILGAETFQHVVSVLNYMPFSILISQLCKSDVEAITFSILAASSNLGYALSQFTGAFIMDILKITPTGNDDTMAFNNLWLASLIVALAPLIPLIFVNFLIPDSSQNENLPENE